MHSSVLMSARPSILARSCGLSLIIPLQFPHEVPEGAVVILFNLKSDVPLEWLLRFSDTLQGLPGLEGEAFQGVMVRPDVYQVRLP